MRELILPLLYKKEWLLMRKKDVEVGKKYRIGGDSIEIKKEYRGKVIKVKNKDIKNISDIGIMSDLFNVNAEDLVEDEEGKYIKVSDLVPVEKELKEGDKITNGSKIGILEKKISEKDYWERDAVLKYEDEEGYIFYSLIKLYNYKLYEKKKKLTRGDTFIADLLLSPHQKYEVGYKTTNADGEVVYMARNLYDGEVDAIKARYINEIVCRNQ